VILALQQGLNSDSGRSVEVGGCCSVSSVASTLVCMFVDSRREFPMHKGRVASGRYAPCQDKCSRYRIAVIAKGQKLELKAHVHRKQIGRCLG